MRLQLNHDAVRLPKLTDGPRASSVRGEPLRVARAARRLAASTSFLAVLFLLFPRAALAEDRVDTTLTWFQERRPGGRGGLTVLHPQFDVGIEGKHVGISAGYEADIVTGATLSIYSVDAVSTATTFDDVRHSGRGSLNFRGRRSTFDVGYAYGQERDYRSHSVTAAGTVDLPGKNTTFGLSYTHHFDRVCDHNNGDLTELERQPLSNAEPCFTDEPPDRSPTVTRAISIDTAQAAITQNVTPTLVVQVGVHGQIIDGFQSNPYRRVRVGENDAQENVPRVRDRGSAFVRANLAIPGLASALGLLVRGYSDTWGVNSVTVEADYHQYLGSRLLFRLRARAYEQTGAIFFKDAIDYRNTGAAGRYFTGDRELAPLRDLLVGGRLSFLSTAESGRSVWGLFDEISLNLKAEALWTQVLTETVPGGDNPGPLPDAVILQLSLLLRY